MQNIHFVDEDFNEERFSFILEWVDKTTEEFKHSYYFEQLNTIEQECYLFLLQIFFEHSYSYCLVGPGKLTPQTIDENMLDVFPRKVSATQSTLES